MNSQLWEILVPTIHGKTGKPIRTRYHRVWDAKVRQISGGLTILHPAKGQWVHPDIGTIHCERMIPVRIACSEEDIERISDMTAVYYHQMAVLFYRVSDKVRVKHYPKIRQEA